MVDHQKTLFIFPGQGAQYRGMGEDLVAASEAAAAVYDRASEALGEDLRDLSFRDPEGVLNRTRYTQPALLTHEIACLEALRERIGEPVMPRAAAGHSLGEYSALVATDALSLEDAVRLVRRRGELMSEHGRGGMMAFKQSEDDLRDLAALHYGAIAGCNLPEQTVVGGDDADLDRLAAAVKERLGSDGIPLKVEGAFHTYLMVGAALAFREALEAVPMREPAVPVVSNVTGRFHASEPAAIKARLFQQLFYPVRWFEGMTPVFEQGIETVVEFGGGIGGGDGPEGKRPNLAGIMKRVIRAQPGTVRYLPAIHAESIEQAAAAWPGPSS
jgi:[acyl-carrier-protein] S-malonyltransferase